MSDDGINYNEDREYYYKNQPEWTETKSEEDKFAFMYEGHNYIVMIYFEVITQKHKNSFRKDIGEDIVLNIYRDQHCDDEVLEVDNEKLFKEAEKYWKEHFEVNFTEV